MEQYAILLVRVSLGLFVAISGANKLFVVDRTQTMYEPLVDANVPFPRLMTYFVSGVELVGGSLLTLGFLSSLACLALLVDMLVAILTTKLSAMPKGLSPLNWLDDFLFVPEVSRANRKSLYGNSREHIMRGQRWIIFRASFDRSRLVSANGW